MILTVDSSTNTACVSLSNDGDILYYKAINDGKTHSQKLLPMIDSCLSKTGVLPKDIEAFAAVIGPGSFTGLRIGIAAIQGIAYTVKKPCIGISTLDAMAYGTESTSGIIVPMIDARNTQAYSAAYDPSKNLSKIMEDTACSVKEIAATVKSFSEDVLFIGDGAHKNRSIIIEEFGLNAKFLDEDSNYTAGKGAAILAQKYFDENNTILPAKLLLPYYYRDTSAKKKFV